MATALPKHDKPALDRADYLRIMDLASAEFHAARAKMTEAEREEMRRIWQEESLEAVADYNRYIEEHGMPLAKYRTF